MFTIRQSSIHSSEINYSHITRVAHDSTILDDYYDELLIKDKVLPHSLIFNHECIFYYDMCLSGVTTKMTLIKLLSATISDCCPYTKSMAHPQIQHLCTVVSYILIPLGVFVTSSRSFVF